jgi:hypothetical protein
MLSDYKINGKGVQVPDSTSRGAYSTVDVLWLANNRDDHQTKTNYRAVTMKSLKTLNRGGAITVMPVI